MGAMRAEPFWDSSRGRFPLRGLMFLCMFSNRFSDSPQDKTMTLWLCVGMTSGRALGHRDAPEE